MLTNVKALSLKWFTGSRERAMYLESINSPKDIKSLNISELEGLAGEIREFLISNVTQTGGHLSPNLGVVELTIALHYAFDMPEDQIIWDVGHQAYVHKILTGRKNDFSTLRQVGGLAGFPKPSESEYDVIHAGHSSTSLSIASGIAQSKKMAGDKSSTVAVIGDGSFTAGMVYEAMNTLSHFKLPAIIILNDNGMSISENVGGISHYLNSLRTSRKYLKFKREIEFLLGRMPGIGKPMKRVLYNLKESVKETLIPGRFFNDMGINYYGPYDGHDIAGLIDLFKEFKDTDRPILLHILTQKGKGYHPSENDPCGYHGISGMCSNGDDSIPIKKSGLSYSKLLGESLTEMAGEDDKVVAVTAAMSTGTGLSGFAEKYPDKMFDVGIAEQHAVDYGLGLALGGFKPVVAIYSTFLQRGFDQLVHDIGISEAGVTFCLDRSGLVPGDGETHQGIFDISYLRMIPNFTVMMPATAREFKMMLRFAVLENESPMAIRYPKDIAEDYDEYRSEDYPILPGEGVTIRKGKDVILVSTGTFLGLSLETARQLEKTGVAVEIYNLRFAKPISEKVTDYLSAGRKPVFIIEEGVETGGVAQYLYQKIKSVKQSKKVEYLTLPDEYPEVDTREGLLAKYGFTAENIGGLIQKQLGRE